MSINNPTINSYRGSFQLDEVYSREVNKDFVDSVGNPGTYGWGIAGANPTTTGVLAVERLDFANDSSIAVGRSNVLLTRLAHAAVNNANYGWIGGGSVPANTSLVERVDFANDNTITTYRGPLSSTRRYLRAASTLNYGWFTGGYVTPVPVSTVDRIDFSNDSTIAAVRGSLYQVTSYHATVGNANYAWNAGGSVPAVTSAISRVDYAADSTTYSPARSFLPVAQYQHSATGNANFGWFIGGTNPALTNAISRLDFSNDTTNSVNRGPLSAVRYYVGATSNANYGWIMGGQPSSIAVTSVIDRIDFVNDTITPLARGQLATARSQVAGTPNYVAAQPTVLLVNNDQVAGFGWIVGGSFPAVGSKIDRIDFTNDTAISSSRANSILPSVRRSFGVNNSIYGWVVGGSDASFYLSQISRLDYANDLQTQSARAPLPIARGQGASFSNVNYGWMTMGGANGPGTNSLTDRLDFSNDLSAPLARGISGAAQLNVAGAGNANYGWAVSYPAPTNTAFRIEYANDLATATTRATVTGGQYMAANSNPNYGWWGATAGQTAIYRLDFANDTAAVGASRGGLTIARFMTAATGNVNYGYWTGGLITPTPYSTVDRLDYATDTNTALARGPLSAVRYVATGVSNYVKAPQVSSFSGNQQGTYGWVFGGTSTTILGNYTYQTSTDRIDFANDTATGNARGTIPVGLSDPGTFNTQFYGWSVAGQGGQFPTYAYLSSTSRLDFSNDSVTAVNRGSLVTGRLGFSSSNTSPTYGYAAGGSAGGPIITSIERLEYASDTTTAVIISLYSGKYQARAGGNENFSYHWCSGGAPQTSEIARLSFSQDFIAPVTRVTIASIRYYGGTTSNRYYLWHVGGLNTSFGSVTDTNRLDFANDTATIVARGNLVTAKAQSAGSGNATSGWTAGSNFITSTVDRMDYATDTNALSVRGPMSVVRWSAEGASNYVRSPDQPTQAIGSSLGAATVGTNGNGSFGYWAGAGPSAATITTVDRLSFVTDLIAVTTRGGMVTSRWLASGVNNANYGWIANGFSTPAAYMLSVERIDYANDSIATTQRGAMAAGRYYGSGASNSNFGWIGGGFSASTLSQVDRIAFAGDTATALVRGPLSIARSYNSSAGNANYGWWVGGQPAPVFSTVDRLDYSNDSATATVRGPISAGRYGISGVSNSNYGWFGGGYIPATGPVTTVNRINFANDTVQPLSRGPLVSARQRMGASGNTNYGWFGGGALIGGTTTNLIDRIDYANDTATSSSRSTLSGNRTGPTSVSNYTK